MKKLIITCILMFFIMTPLHADTGIYIYQNQDILGETFDTLYNGDEKTLYSFAYDSNNQTISLEANFYIDGERIFSYEEKEAILGGYGTYYISMYDMGILTGIDHEANRVISPTHIRRGDIDPDLMNEENIVYIRQDKEPLKNEKTLIMKAEATIDGQYHLMEIYMYPYQE